MLIPRHQYFDSGRGNSSFMASITLVNKPLSLPYLNELPKQKRTLLMRPFRLSFRPCIRDLMTSIFFFWKDCSSLESFKPDGVIAIFGVRFTKSALSYLVSPSPLSITKSHTRRMVRPIDFSSGSVFPPGLTPTTRIVFLGFSVLDNSREYRYVPFFQSLARQKRLSLILIGGVLIVILVLCFCTI